MQRPEENPDFIELWTALHPAFTSVKSIPKLTSTTIQEIFNYLQQLPEPIGRAIQLRYFQHQSIATIALSLHSSRHTARNLLDKGLHRLRKRFNPAYQDQLHRVRVAHVKQKNSRPQ
jgi:DNA-directed RNA polymerase specialized sigma24 family protein